MQLDYTLTEIEAVAKKIIAATQGRNCIAFFAPMGAGKTTLIKALVEELEGSGSASSPTFGFCRVVSNVDIDKSRVSPFLFLCRVMVA